MGAASTILTGPWHGSEGRCRSSVFAAKNLQRPSSRFAPVRNVPVNELFCLSRGVRTALGNVPYAGARAGVGGGGEAGGYRVRSYSYEEEIERKECKRAEIKDEQASGSQSTAVNWYGIMVAIFVYKFN